MFVNFLGGRHISWLFNRAILPFPQISSNPSLSRKQIKFVIFVTRFISGHISDSHINLFITPAIHKFKRVDIVYHRIKYRINSRETILTGHDISSIVVLSFDPLSLFFTINYIVSLLQCHFVNTAQASD